MMRILAVDDDDISLKLVKAALESGGHEVFTAHDGVEALDILGHSDIRVLITDWVMPGMDGIELCRRIRSEPMLGYVYVIFVTSRSAKDDTFAGLSVGADEFIGKPFDPVELLVRVKTAERILSLESRQVTIFSLAKLTESRDPETGLHLERIREYSRLLADHVSMLNGNRQAMSPGFAETIYQTSPLHDIGKVGIPDHILLKPGRLTVEEFEVMKTHTTIGGDTLRAAVDKFPKAEYLNMASEIATSHHEHYDGKGYPCGLKGETIPMSARVVAIADVYDALTMKRVYKSAMPHEQAREIILKDKGSHFDPVLVDAFVAKEQEILAIQKNLSAETKNP
jgi:putative two-component system response regulator